jgi:hypothetical protein
MARGAKHGLGASRTFAASAVCGEIFGASVRFAFDDSPGCSPFARAMHEDCTDEGWGDVQDFAVVERTR